MNSGKQRAGKETIEKARLLYLDGRRPKEIAEELGVPGGTVRRWKCTYNWDNDPNKENKPKKEKNRNERASNLKKQITEFKDLKKSDVMNRLVEIGYKPEIMDEMGAAQISAMVKALIYLADNIQEEANTDDQCVIQMIQAVPEDEEDEQCNMDATAETGCDDGKG